jgi:hypothetical protein
MYSVKFLMSLILREETHPDDVVGHMNELHRVYRNLLADILDSGRQKGVFRATVNPRLDASLILTALHGLLVQGSWAATRRPRRRRAAAHQERAGRRSPMLVRRATMSRGGALASWGRSEAVSCRGRRSRPRHIGTLLGRWGRPRRSSCRCRRLRWCRGRARRDDAAGRVRLRRAAAEDAAHSLLSTHAVTPSSQKPLVQVPGSQIAQVTKPSFLPHVERAPQRTTLPLQLVAIRPSVDRILHLVRDAADEVAMVVRRAAVPPQLARMSSRTLWKSGPLQSTRRVPASREGRCRRGARE